MREPKKVRTIAELIKSCRMLREHNEKLKGRNSELEARLEISPDHDVDGIEARDETIKLLDDRIEQLEGRLHDADLQGAKLKIRLNQIAIYPDPDFPAGDEAEEAKRAWQIIYILKGIAGGKE